MTGESPTMRRPATCPDPELLAAHADRRLTGAEAARMDEHIAGCPDCYAVFAATIQFALSEEDAVKRSLAPAVVAPTPVAPAAPPATVARAAAPLAFVRRPGFRTAAGLATGGCASPMRLFLAIPGASRHAAPPSVEQPRLGGRGGSSSRVPLAASTTASRPICARVRDPDESRRPPSGCPSRLSPGSASGRA